MKLFLVGAKSPTGKALVQILREQRIRFLAPPEKYFVPENAKQISRMITDFSPTQLVNLADFISGNHGALRKAESQEERCRRINAEMPAVLAVICQRLKIPLCHLSNAYVFDGEKKLGYNENDEPNPVGIYGQSSLAGEQAVQENDSHIILRSGWLFGD
ncbi:MAG: sugar nucleotide-binding protein, partial [Pseudomonadales bacterium]